MDPFIALFLKVSAGVGSFVLFVYVLFRLVLASKKAGRTGAGGHIAGVLLTFLGLMLSLHLPEGMSTDRRVDCVTLAT